MGNRRNTHIPERRYPAPQIIVSWISKGAASIEHKWAIPRTAASAMRRSVPSSSRLVVPDSSLLAGSTNWTKTEALGRTPALSGWDLSRKQTDDTSVPNPTSSSMLTSDLPVPSMDAEIYQLATSPTSSSTTSPFIGKTKTSRLFGSPRAVTTCVSIPTIVSAPVGPPPEPPQSSFTPPILFEL